MTSELELDTGLALTRAAFNAINGGDYVLARIYLDCLGRRADHLHNLAQRDTAAAARTITEAQRPIYPDHDPALTVWKEALDTADTQIQQAVSEAPCGDFNASDPCVPYCDTCGLARTAHI